MKDLRSQAASYRKEAAVLAQGAVSRQRANFALNAGNQLMLRGQIADAIARYQESVAADPTFAEAHAQLAIAYQRQGRADEAAAERTKAAELGQRAVEYSFAFLAIPGAFMKHRQSHSASAVCTSLMRSFRWPLLFVMALHGIFPTLHAQQRRTEQRWTEAQANDWYARQPWPVGADFLPSTAINELEMWQADTFDEPTIDRELGWAEATGMNTMRVFLHNLLWEQDPKGFQQRIDRFLTIASRHHIRPVFVLFDSCWDPHPRLGPQHPPIPGVHNSGWVQAPGAKILADPAQYPRLQSYVEGVVGAFANDPRILAWDLWNEPDNGNEDSYKNGEPRNKNEIIAGLLPQVYQWARSVHPTQPLTSGLWHGDWTSLRQCRQ